MPAAPQHLIISASARHYGLVLSEVVEVIRPRAITRVPNAPAALLGVANFRGSALPVLSLARLLDQEDGERTDRTRIVVLAGGVQAGLLVDGIASISQLHDHAVLDTSSLIGRAYSATTQRAHPRRAASQVSLQQTGPETDDRIALLTFEVCGQDFALPLSEICAVIKLPSEINVVPRTDSAIMGVTQHRAQLLPLVSLPHLLGLEGAEAPCHAGSVLIVQLAGKAVGLVVGGVCLVVRVRPDALDPVPSVLTRGQGEASLSAICRLDEGKLVSVLASDRLFDVDTTSRLMASSGNEDMAPVRNTVETREQFVVFQLGEERYGLPIGAVDEVVRRPPQLTRVPGAPSFVEGIMNLRGKMIPVIDQRQRFSVAGQRQDAARIIVLTVDGLQTGIAVDRVDEILSVASSELTPTPGMETGNAVVDRVAMADANGTMVLLVEPRALLDRAERDLIAAMENKAPGQV